MSFLSIVQLREVFVDVFDCDEGPCQVVAVADAAEPGLLDGKTSGSVEVLYGPFDARKLIYIVDGIRGGWEIGGG